MEMKRAKAEKDKRQKLQNSIGKLRDEAIETLQKMIEGHRDLIKQLETHIEQVRNGECDETIIQNAEKKPEQKFTNTGIKSKKEPAVRKRSKRTIIDRDATRDMLPHGFVLRAKCANGEIMAIYNADDKCFYNMENNKKYEKLQEANREFCFEIAKISLGNAWDTFKAYDANNNKTRSIRDLHIRNWIEEDGREYTNYQNLNYRDWETDRKSTRLNSSHRL